MSSSSPSKMPARLQKYLCRRNLQKNPTASLVIPNKDNQLSEYVTSSYNNCETRIYVHTFSETVSDYIRVSKNFFEISFLDFLRKNFPIQKEILDIGANIGNHTLFFTKFLNCQRVHSFEPVGKNFSILQKNVENYKDKCICYQVALSNKDGKMPLYNSQKENYGGFSLHCYSNGSSFLVSESIDVKTLDSFQFENISMIKIDVENHENEILEGARDTILRNKPIILLENLYYGYPHVCKDPNPHEKILSELGYVKKYSNIENSLMDLWQPSN